MMRCSTCILPDSIPGIRFNSDGVCNYCLEKFPSYAPKGDAALNKLLHEHMLSGAPADCLVGVSGGKDSTYTLAVLKNKFDMRVEAFTYTHDGSTSRALENARTVCEELKVPHYIVSLDNHRHLKTFSGFLDAWIKAPSATTAGMVCVACKHLHLLGSEIAKQRGIPMIVWSSSPLESPPFLALKYKGGSDERERRDGMAKGASLFAKEMFKTTAFSSTFVKHLSTCVQGCLAVFPTSRYLRLRYPGVYPILFYDYHPWNPTLVRDYVQNNAGWRAAEGTEDWHSDCIFNTFKEYMFLKMYGASYTDAFYSNQIRFGMMTRAEAMQKLAVSRRHFAVELHEIIDMLDMHHLDDAIDPEVFLEHMT